MGGKCCKKKITESDSLNVTQQTKSRLMVSSEGENSENHSVLNKDSNIDIGQSLEDDIRKIDLRNSIDFAVFGRLKSDYR